VLVWATSANCVLSFPKSHILGFLIYFSLRRYLWWWGTAAFYS
jgi:hypothetical protein